MHELSIAVEIIEIVEKSARKSGAENVDTIELEIGELSGIEIEALKMALDISVKNTIADGAEINIHTVKAEAHCIDCGKDSAVDDLFSVCPTCGSFRMDIIKGKEMKIKSITVNNNN
jgi:hydrogenase nickel incorporation protein HypA/HybF